MPGPIEIVVSVTGAGAEAIDLARKILAVGDPRQDPNAMKLARIVLEAGARGAGRHA